jgi:hypothetical protein
MRRLVFWKFCWKNNLNLVILTACPEFSGKEESHYSISKTPTAMLVFFYERKAWVSLQSMFLLSALQGSLLQSGLENKRIEKMQNCSDAFLQTKPFSIFEL